MEKLIKEPESRMRAFFGFRERSFFIISCLLRKIARHPARIHPTPFGDKRRPRFGRCILCCCVLLCCEGS